MSDKRIRRIAEEIKKTISSLILKDLKDPRIDQMASITHVEVSRDYSIAKIYVSTFDQDLMEGTVDGLNSAKGFIKRELSKDLKLRIMPDLIFLSDDSIAKSFELYDILNKVQKEEK